MSEHTENTDNTDNTPYYDVVLLVEQELSAADVGQVRSLHESLDEPVRYHVLVPIEHSAERVEAAMGYLAAGEMMATPAMASEYADLESVRAECREHSQNGLDATLRRFTESGATAVGRLVGGEHPVQALTETVEEVGGREAVVLTRPHVVAEFFHTDWASRARRHLGVPVLHLLEHETFDEQAGGGEGITGM